MPHASASDPVSIAAVRASYPSKVRDALGSFYDQSNQLRTALGEMDAALINAFDQRYVEHVPDA